MQRLMFWGLFGLTLAVYGAMLGWSLPTISGAAGGLVPFDMRPGGYGFADALTFVSALSTDGGRFYLHVQQKLDIAYPVLIALTLFFAIAALLPGQLGRWRWILATPAALIAIFDYLENHAVAMMIEAGPLGLTHDLVAEASQWTVLKSNTTMVVIVALLARRAAQVAIHLWRSKVAGLVARGR
jgi:hypothetical protein